MKKIKVLFLCLIIILVTGCTGSYNLTINEDLTVKENADLVLDDEAKNYEKFAMLLSNNIENKDDYKLTKEGNDLRIIYNHEYDSIEDYLLDSELYKQLFDSISYNSDGREISFETSNIFNLKSSKLSHSNSINSLRINVTTPLEVIYDNSDENVENTYTWILNNNTKEKEINLTFNLGNNKINTSSMIVFISLAISLVIIIVIIIRRLLESQKI